MSDLLLLFLDRLGGFDGWRLITNGESVSHGAALDGLPAFTAPPQIAAIVPAEEVALHRIELPAGLAPAQAVAAARLMAADLTAQAPVDMHVAVGADEGGTRMCALVPSAVMSEWLETCREAGFDPDLVLPETLLLLPQEGRLVRFDREPLPLFRAEQDAFSIEPELAALASPGAAVETIDQQRFEAELAEAVRRLPVNLRQGVFAKARKWKVEWRVARRLALLAAALLIATAAIQIATITRYTFAADAAEADADALAASALPKGSPAADAPRRLRTRLVEVQGSSAGFGALASILFDGIRATPNAELAGLLFDQGALRATIIADAPATVTALAARIEGQGAAVETGGVTQRDGRQAIELTVRAR